MTKFLLLFLLSINGQLLFSQTFINHHTANSPLPDNQCRWIAIDSIGRKWFCTQYGIAVYNDTTWTVYNSANSGLTNNSVRHLVFDNQGTAWISTQSGGVCTFNGTTWNSYTKSNSGIISNYIKSVHIAPNNIKWICTDQGLNSFDGTNWELYDVVFL